MLFLFKRSFLKPFMKNILVPVGASTNATNHLQYAVDFAKSFGAKIYVVQIYNVYTKAGTLIKVDDIIERKSREFLEEHIASVDAKGVELELKTFKGDVIDILEFVCEELAIDLIVLEPKTSSVKEDVFLGKLSGRIIKRTQLPALVVPEGYVYKPISSILMALRSVVVKKQGVLKPLIEIMDHYKAPVNLLLVKTPSYEEGDFEVPDELSAIISKTKETQNATTYQGILEHYQAFQPDLLCVVRRKRGFFNKLWEGDTILKKDFYVSSMPVLILSGLK
jgi:nucleotide-binding universal stress UspA family protein